MATEAMIKALNEQVWEEMNSSYIYLAMAADMEAKNHLGSAAWFKKQSQEEWGHAMRIWEYLYDIGGKVVLQAFKAPPAEYSGLLEAFEASLKHEKHISHCIHQLVRQARKEDDLPTENFLQWFIKEQVEEEKTAAEILAKIQWVGAGTGVYFIDKELGKRALSKVD